MAMSITQYESSDGFTVPDLVRLAAEHALGIEVTEIAPQVAHTPVCSGRFLAQEVQPGLIATASDLTFLTDGELNSNAEPAVLCGVLLDGPDEERMEVGGYGWITRKRDRPCLFGYAATTSFRHPIVASQQSSAAGVMIKRDFFDQFGRDITDDGLVALRGFFDAGFRFEMLARSARITELARRTLDHPYNSQLGRLFLESNALSLVVEFAEHLKRERRMEALIGKRHYERVVEARDVLDANLSDPPKTLELARRVGVNLTTLQMNFKAAFGTTIFGYVRTQRLQMARVLLLEHDLTIAEAGYRVGFASPAAFTAAYRRHFGHPPGSDVRYRQ
jgi:AraC-like DNA-binding protein